VTPLEKVLLNFSARERNGTVERALALEERP
jgi:hypothetical protein